MSAFMYVCVCCFAYAAQSICLLCLSGVCVPVQMHVCCMSVCKFVDIWTEYFNLFLMYLDETLLHLSCKNDTFVLYVCS